jgi:predicted MFS family arabinose efflux permease
MARYSLGSEKLNHEEKAPGKLFLLSLFMSLLVAGVPVIISGLLLIDIGQTFGYPVGVTGQIATAYSAISVIFALIMGVLSARYRHKTLLTAGLLLYVISAVSSYVSPNFPVLIVAYSLTGIGSSIVFPMTATIIGEAFPPERRASALGWVTAGQPFSVLVGSPTVNYIASQYGWRSYFGIPKSSHRPVSSSRSSFEGFRSILSNRSALACLAGALFVQVNLSNVLPYGVSSFRERFLSSSGVASLIFSGMALTAFTGSIVGGNVVGRFGRKRVVAAASLLLGIFTIVTFNLGLFWPSALASITLFLFASSSFVAGNSLSLEQVPEFSGTLMSVNGTARSLGATLGTMMGGLVLLQYGYWALGLTAGAFGVLAVLIYHFFTVDPSIS